MKVGDAMTKEVKVAREDSTIEYVANEMKNLNIGSIPVCDLNNKLLGIVTDRDIVVRGLSQGKGGNYTVKDVMTTNPVSVSPETSIHEATDIMSQNQIRRLPVVDNGTLVGILAIGDVAVRDNFIDQAGDALSSISEPIKPSM
ncbi:MAG: CBS domain-containing protein [Clostridiaceae bacterium]|nr:CBS domain-containing protein [Clostridiaceae bacterium]MBW4860727.1 CBS domain-containing protein [Clostridiaceae bacterium]MBW4869019.1 CBS domain-containing protein [Clostridiaceae bacterium]